MKPAELASRSSSAATRTIEITDETWQRLQQIPVRPGPSEHATEEHAIRWLLDHHDAQTARPRTLADIWRTGYLEPG